MLKLTQTSSFMFSLLNTVKEWIEGQSNFESVVDTPTLSALHKVAFKLKCEFSVGF